MLAIGAMTNRPPMTLYVHPDITRTEQLKGQTLGITRFNSTAHTVTTLILRKLGLEQTATMRPLGGQPEIQAVRTKADCRNGDRGQAERRRALC